MCISTGNTFPLITWELMEKYNSCYRLQQYAHIVRNISLIVKQCNVKSFGGYSMSPFTWCIVFRIRNKICYWLCKMCRLYSSDMELNYIHLKFSMEIYLPHSTIF
jgi:hypothetical protein